MARWRWFLWGVAGLASFVTGGRLAEIAVESQTLLPLDPYIQMLGSDQAMIRWQDDAAERSILLFGTDPERLAWRAEEQQAAARHIFTLAGLTPDTVYYYAIADRHGINYAGPHYWFQTAPIASRPLRLWVIGDPGQDGPPLRHALEGANRWLQANPRPNLAEFDLLLTTGDNAYKSGKGQEFAENFFRPLAPWLRNTAVWPAYGNHDSRRNAFFDLFTLPQQGELGGVPSATPHYYSLDYGDLHLVMLDSEGSSLAADGAMARWLAQDLAANEKPWTIAIIHHPPYTHGSHNSDSWRDSWGRMARVRENILPILERYGVALLLGGHSHSYERSHLLACHYGDSTTFDATRHLRDAGKRHGAALHYQQSANGGMIHAVVGSTARLDGAPLNHPALPIGHLAYGSLMIDIDGDTLSGNFIATDGSAIDRFVLHRRPLQLPLAACVE
jgi:acid phosphatase type 7